MNPFLAVSLSWTLNKLVALSAWCLMVAGGEV